MLGVTSVNRCQACEAVHGRWAKGVGLRLDDLSTSEAAAYAFGQRLAVSGPHDAPPPADLSRRARPRVHWGVSILMELANLAGNRFLAPRAARPAFRSATDALPACSTSGCVPPIAPGSVTPVVVSPVELTATPSRSVSAPGRTSGCIPRASPFHGVDVSPPALSLAAARRISNDGSWSSEGDAGSCRSPTPPSIPRRDLRPLFGRRCRPEPS